MVRRGRALLLAAAVLLAMAGTALGAACDEPTSITLTDGGTFLTVSFVAMKSQCAYIEYELSRRDTSAVVIPTGTPLVYPSVYQPGSSLGTPVMTTSGGNWAFTIAYSSIPTAAQGAPLAVRVVSEMEQNACMWRVGRWDDGPAHAAAAADAAAASLCNGMILGCSAGKRCSHPS